MGLMDILNGMQNGPRGQSQPSSASPTSGGGMSPTTMALLGLLAYKAFKAFGGAQPASPGAGRAAPLPGGTPASLPGGGTMTAGSPQGGLGVFLAAFLAESPEDCRRRGNPAQV